MNTIDNDRGVVNDAQKDRHYCFFRGVFTSTQAESTHIGKNFSVSVKNSMTNNVKVTRSFYVYEKTMTARWGPSVLRHQQDGKTYLDTGLGPVCCENLGKKIKTCFARFVVARRVSSPCNYRCIKDTATGNPVIRPLLAWLPVTMH